jgi:hypothetical protein
MIWRKHYRSMYEGSLIGAGATAFALMGYVISHQEFDRAIMAWVVRLHPGMLAYVLGEKEASIMEAVGYLCKPDPASTSKAEGGRRLVKLAPDSMEYRVVNGETYQGRLEYENRKEQNRVAQRKFRAKNDNGKSKQGAAERRFTNDVREGRKNLDGTVPFSEPQPTAP